MVKQFHDGMQARVQDNDETSEPLPVTKGVKQGCVLPPSLFSLMFSAMLTDAFRDGDIGIGIRYRTDGKLFNLRRLQAKNKIWTNIIRDVLFADVCTLNAGSEADIQRSVDKFSDACNDFGLTISITKTEVMHQPAPGKAYIEPSVTAHGQRLNVVNRFTYVGSTLPKTLSSTAKSTPGSRKPAHNFFRQQARRGSISLQTKLNVYMAIVLPTLPCACETWTVYQRHVRKLNHFYTTSLRRLLNIKWQDKIPDTKVLAQAGLPSIHTILMQSQLR